jgi:hypothetical protein
LAEIGTEASMLFPPIRTFSSFLITSLVTLTIMEGETDLSLQNE